MENKKDKTYWGVNENSIDATLLAKIKKNTQKLRLTS